MTYSWGSIGQFTVQAQSLSSISCGFDQFLGLFLVVNFDQPHLHIFNSFVTNFSVFLFSLSRDDLWCFFFFCFFQIILWWVKFSRLGDIFSFLVLEAIFRVDSFSLLDNGTCYYWCLVHKSPDRVFPSCQQSFHRVTWSSCLFSWPILISH